MRVEKMRTPAETRVSASCDQKAASLSPVRTPADPLRACRPGEEEVTKAAASPSSEGFDESEDAASRGVEMRERWVVRWGRRRREEASEGGRWESPLAQQLRGRACEDSLEAQIIL